MPDGRLAAVLIGEIDADAVADLAQTLTARVPDLFDADGVEFFSAAGLTLLLRIAGDRGIDVVASPPVARLIELCGVGDRLRVVDRSSLDLES